MFFVYSEVVGHLKPPLPSSSPLMTSEDDPEDMIDATFSLASAAAALFNATYSKGNLKSDAPCPYNAWAQVRVLQSLYFGMTLVLHNFICQSTNCLISSHTFRTTSELRRVA